MKLIEAATTYALHDLAVFPCEKENPVDRARRIQARKPKRLADFEVVD